MRKLRIWMHPLTCEAVTPPAALKVMLMLSTMSTKTSSRPLGSRRMSMTDLTRGTLSPSAMPAPDIAARLAIRGGNVGSVST